MKTKLPGKKLSHYEQLLDTTVEMKLNPNRDAAELAYMARQLVQCTLPHSNPGNVPVWRRTNGDLTLTIRPNYDRAQRALYPYGTIPRLVMFWLVTEATQKKSRRIELGDSLDNFMREIGLNPRTGGGKRGDAKRLHDQMERLFSAVISFDNYSGRRSFANMTIASKGQLWWTPKKSGQQTLLESWIELGEDFFAAITAAPVPVDMRALKGLKRSPLALDLYALLTYKTFIASEKKEPLSIPWAGLHAQMGGEYTRLRAFKEKVEAALRKIRLVYPGVRVEVTPEGLTIYPAKTAIASKKVIAALR